MHYIIYGIFYLFSLLPFFILYFISDIIFCIIYYGGLYRKKVVMDNLAIAFPEKTLLERKKIAREFYRNFIDSFIEMIKMFSISGAGFDKRALLDATALNELAAKGKNIQFHAGHQMNWEYANWVFARRLSIPWVGVYQPLGNKLLDRIFFKLRAKHGTVLVSTKEFRNRMHEVFKEQYSLALAADQNPWNLDNSYWLYFFGKKTAFVTGPDKGAIKSKAAVVFAKMVKVKRGHYHFVTKTITENAGAFQPGELTLLYRDFLEETIRESPANYLWTHKRWKYTFNEANKIFQSNWIDKANP
jgi:Kdo2-lipid IVA lauroyltransferase/acyltransferase